MEDQPLFDMPGSEPKRPRYRKPETWPECGYRTRRYRGKLRTCDQCILVLAKGRQPRFTRDIGTYLVTWPAREVLLCHRHLQELRDGGVLTW